MTGRSHLRLALFVVTAILGGSLAIFGGACARVELQDAPDGGVKTCPPAPVLFCDASVPSPTTCRGNPSAAGPEKNMPSNADFEPDCRAYLLTTLCEVQFACRCTPSDGGSSQWICL